MKKLILTGIIVFYISSNVVSQNNIIPNSGFESGSTPRCDYASLSDQNSSGIEKFNLDVDNWEVDDKQGSANKGNLPSPDYLSFWDCNTQNNPWVAQVSQCTSLFPLFNKPANRFIRLSSNVVKDCDKRRKDYVGVALENGGVFQPYKTYRIRYKVVPIMSTIEEKKTHKNYDACLWSLSFCHLRFFLSKKGPKNWTDVNNTVEELINVNYQTGFQSNCEWRQIERSFYCQSSNMTTLVLMAETGGFFIDDVEVFEQCDNSSLIQNKIYSYPFYSPNAVEGKNFKEEAGATLTAGANVGLNNGIGPVEVEYGSYVIYTAISSIRLKIGFKAQNYSHFHAKLDPNCPNSINQRISQDGNFSHILNGEEINELFGRVEKSSNDKNNDVTNNFVNVSPNPFNNELNIKSERNIKNINIINNLGQSVYSLEEINQNNFNIKIDERLNQGIYYLSIFYNDGSSVNKILMK